MAKVTGKLQVTVPKALALQLGIRPGDDVDWAFPVSAAAEGAGAPADLELVNRLRDQDP